MNNPRKGSGVSMKWIIVCLIALSIFCQAGAEALRADIVTIPPPPTPSSPVRKTERPESKVETFPAYSVAAGVVAVALSGSLVALRIIRKRNGKSAL
jgi:hypothetical protein